ncbi:hypothetical protein Emtol_3956 [Emticicia oligotrophica DSM 17448]|uniref:Lipopolysaccharide biosynthesis protein n=1 Tax=Emticicia oligotrophica (strain DSM 17448 / CIP 109782 / MTCC 6937 / GPTSA100-15) TaxID=929562 RepID=A0ABN4ATR5_EMTOG|nr:MULTISPECIES: hypothetical protein [Emticicia]AFK05082.1 hypothetical protein Emtol_3956 [Emticicia oligotrophica DSM 17448]
MAEYQTIQEEQISTKDFVKKIINLFILIGNEWRLLLISIALGTFFSLLLDVKELKDTEYTGEIQFNLESGSGQAAFGGLGGLAGAFGFGGAGTTSNDLFSGGNFGLLITSKTLYEKALMKEVMIGGKKTLFINFYKDSSDIAKKEWGGDLLHEPNYKAIKYRFNPKSPNDFTKDENIILSTIYEKLEAQTTLQPLDKNGSIMVLSATTNSEFLTKVWLETLLETLKEFYVEVRTRKTRDIYDIQMIRLRELEGKLSSTDRQLAQAQFQNQNAVDPNAPMRTMQLNRSNNYVSTQYFQQLAAVEQLKMQLINQTPLFTVLQPVRLPLLQRTYTVGGNTLKGAFVGFFLCLLYIIMRRTYLELMS